jgi:hypothetical protein
MPRKQLKDRCLFIDAYVYDETTRKPTSTKKPAAIQSPHIFDQRTDPATYLMLNDTAAFIARFIVLGVDTTIIPQIYLSEYPAAGGNAAKEVADVLTMVDPYLEDRDFKIFQRTYQSPQALGNAKPYHGISGRKGYDLDFNVNWFGTGGLLKGPL